MVSRIQWAIVLLAMFVTLTTGTLSAAPPNVVLILIDDLGATDLGCYGTKFYKTPNLDRMASEGMRFTQAYAACPVCSPTRAALMTGKYPARVRVTDWIPGGGYDEADRLATPAFRQELPLAETTIAERLKLAGYRTASIGKWHLGGEGFSPTDQGFDLNKGGVAAGGVASHFAPFLKGGRKLPGLEDAPDGEYLADRLTTEALRWIEANREHPFFLYLPHYAVHTPLGAAKDRVAAYESLVNPRSLQRNATYAAMMENMDENVGRVLTKLAELGLADNTLVIFTSDNGGLATTEGAKTPATNNAPLREGKGYLYEGGIRVPLIIRWPTEIAGGSTCNVPTSSVDLPVSIAEACGLAPDLAVNGVSIRRLWKQAGEITRDALYWHYPHYSNQGGNPGGAIRQGPYKLIEFYENARRELYNVEQDVSESTNLIDREPERAVQMAAKLAEWRKALDVQMPEKNPKYKPPHPDGEGIVTLPARKADIHGVMVRYEPLPHKNTLGFWVRPDDWVSWDFETSSPATFEVEILQGCGAGSGGSEVEFRCDDQAVTTKVVETGGFQQFEARQIGKLEIAKPGRHTLSVKPLSKPGAAVMDLRQVRLLPVGAK